MFLDLNIDPNLTYFVDRCAADLKETMIDDYLDFCERALLPETDDDGGKVPGAC